jgi:hypothetical protein
LITADEAQAGVTGKRAGQQTGFAEHLKAVAYPKHRKAFAGRRDDLSDHRGKAGDGTGAQVIAVGEAAGKDDRVNPAKIRIGVPERDRFAAGKRNGAQGVAIVE